VTQRLRLSHDVAICPLFNVVTVREYLGQQVGVVCGLQRRPRDPVHRDAEPNARGLPPPGVGRGQGAAFLPGARLRTRGVSLAQAAAARGVRTSRGGIINTTCCLHCCNSSTKSGHAICCVQASKEHVPLPPRQARPHSDAQL
jgi:hypothetical protein